MNFKKVFNDKLAFGYGSKYQLLRMLGWHRNELNKEVSKATGFTNDINWLDFNFDGPFDKEIKNADFINELATKWKEYWACGSTSGLNWDAIGVTSNNEYIPIEAKAYINEFINKKDKDGSKSEESKKNHLKRVQDLIDKYQINDKASNWINHHYQLANRLVFVDFLISNGYKAKLAYVLFENGYEFNCPTVKSCSKEEWENACAEKLNKMHIKGTKLEDLICFCIINCNKKD